MIDWFLVCKIYLYYYCFTEYIKNNISKHAVKENKLHLFHSKILPKMGPKQYLQINTR